MARDYLIYQDIDLKNNTIKNADTINSGSGKNLNITSGSNLELNASGNIDLNNSTNVSGDLTVGQTTETGKKALHVTGNSQLDGTVLINENVIIKWDSTQQTLVFEKKVSESNG